MAQGFKPKQLADWIGIATSTLRMWTRSDFRHYLSPTAQGGQGKRRFYSERDARIVALIANLKAESVPADDIHVTLRRMQADNWHDLPPMPAAPPGQEPIRLVPESTAETAITTQRQAMMREIGIQQDTITHLTEDLDETKSTLATAQDTIRQLSEQLGRARGMLVSGVALVIVLAVVAVALAVVLLTRG